MILAHWYFCSSIKLSVQETADYLELMYVLERRSSVRDCIAALEQLERLDELQRAYAIPLLVSQLTSTPGRSMLKNCSDEDQTDMLIAKIRNLLRRSLSQDGQSEVPVSGIVNRLDRIPLDDIPQIVWDQYHPTQLLKKEALNSYLETAKFSVDIFWLSLLKIAGEEYPEIVKELDFTTHLDAPLHHGYGELPWQLAFEIACLSAQDFQSVQLYLNSSWMRNPACVGQIQKLLLLQKKETVEEGKSAVYPILQESYLLNLFDKKYRYWENNNSTFWADHRAAPDTQKILCAIIWQISAWETAFALDRGFCVQVFQHWWATPVYGTKAAWAKDFGISKTAKQLLRESNTVFYNENMVSFSISSPWQRSIPDGMAGPERFSSFPFMKKSFLVLRSCCAAYLLRSILSEQRKEDFQINYYRLLLNLGDAFRHEDTDREIKSKGRGPFWSAPLCALSLFAQQCIRLMGMGIENPKIPVALFKALTRSKSTNNDELNRLKTQGYLICAHWAVQRLYYGNPRTITEANPWFIADAAPDFAESGENAENNSPAAKELCRILFNSMREYAVKSTDAVELLYQKFRYDPEFQYILPPYWDSCYLDSPMQYLEEDRRISPNDILLAGDLPVKRWMDLSVQGEGLCEKYFTKEAWLLALTMRLVAVLQQQTQDDQEGTFRKWYQQWQSSIFSVPVQTLRKNRSVMFAVCDMLRPGTLSEDKVNYDVLKNNIISDAIDLIYDVTEKDSVYELLLLSEHLSQEQPHFPFNTNMLRTARIQHMKKLFALSRKQPVFSVFLEKFICSISEYLMMPLADELRRKMDSFWQDQCVGSDDVRAKQITEQDWNPLTDRFLRQKDKAWVAARPTVDISSTWYHGKAANRFKESAVWEDEPKIICGIIADMHIDRQADKSVYRVNCGNNLITVTVNGDERRRKIGDVVQINRRGKDYKFHKPAWKPGTESETVRVRIKQLSTDNHSQMKMRMVLPTYEEKEFAEGNSVISELLDAWAPDTASFVPGTMPLQNPRTSYEAVYDEQLQAYVPAKRSYARFLLERVFLPGNPQHKVWLTYIGSELISGEYFDLFSAEAGFNYLLPRQIWDEDSRTQLAAEMVFSKKVQVCVCIADGAPLLQLDAAEPFDDTNIILEQLLTEGTAYWMECGTSDSNLKDRWIQVDFQEKTQMIACVLDKVYAPRHTNVELVPGGWDRMCQRKRAANCVEIRGYRIQSGYSAPDQIAKLIQVKPGDVVRMDRLLNPDKEARNGYYTAQLSSGILAQCAAESISMLGTPNPHLCINRLCIVENVYISSLEQTRLVENMTLDGTEEETDRLDGIVTIYSPVKESDENSSMMQEVTFLTKNGILKVIIPMNRFQRCPQNLGSLVSALRQPDNTWSIQASERRINIRALWAIQEHNLPGAGEIIGTALGKSVRIPGKGYKTVSQDHCSPILHLWQDDILLHDEPRCGIADGRGIIKAVWRRNCDPKLFHYAKYTDIVQLSYEKMHYWGEANRGEFSAAGSAWSVEFSLGLSVAADDVEYFDIRRCFCREQILEKASKPRAKEQIQTYIELYHEWLTGLDRHVYGEISGNQLKLHNMHVPHNTDASSAADQWDDTIPMLPGGAKPWVVPNPEKPYSRTVRAILRLKDNQWYASCRDAHPFRLNDQLVNEFKAVENEKIRIALYYAGPEKAGYLRFEWGHGYSFLTRKEDIVDYYGNNISMELFYGDRIQEFSLRRSRADAPGEFGWHMVVPADAIQHEISWQIWRDSQSSILQLLRVHVDRTKQTVDIREVSMVEYNVSRYQKTNKGWSFHAFHNGRLHPESVRKLLEEDAAAVREQVIIGKVEITEEEAKAQGIYFDYISLEDAEQNHKLLEGNTLCLTAGYIKPLQRGWLPGNDYFLDFYLPNVMQGTDEDVQEHPFSVNVIRRSFSLDESKLRVLAAEHPDEFYRKNMLVKILPARDSHKWSGSILSTPIRHIESLREWVHSKNNCLVVLDNPYGDNVSIEVSPGILCQLPVDAFEGQVHKGAIALLRLEDEKIRGRIILPGDRNYIPKEGRAVELLPKDDVYRQFLNQMRGEEAAEQPQRGSRTADIGKFTIASFPQLEVSNQCVMEEMICRQPPRLCWLEPDRFDADKYFINSSMRFYAAKLGIDRFLPHPKLHYVYPEEKIVQTEWNKLSFMDARPEEVAVFARHGKWHYHDKETAVYDPETQKISKLTLPKGNRFYEILLFPNYEGDLRFPFRKKEQNIYSARELAEYGLPRDNAKYPVAYSSPDSLYVEMMPGRVVELPKHYLFCENDDSPLSDFYCGSLAQGDFIHLGNGISFDNGQRQINVTGFTFGGRHYFGLKRNYLPVIRVEPDSAVLLGSEKAPLVYPTSQTDAFIGKTLASLNYRNELVPFYEETRFESGDTVMVTLDQDGFFKLEGYPGSIAIKCAPPTKWKDAQWIYELLGSSFGKPQLFEAIGGRLTVKVDSFVRHGNHVEMSILIEQDNLDRQKVGTILCVKCLGLLTFKHVNYLLVCCGRTIMRIPAGNILPDMPDEALHAVVACLVEQNVSLWLHREGDGWYCGIAGSPDAEQVEVDLMYCVENADGFLCSNTATRELCWLPRHLAARVGKYVSCRHLWNALSHRPRRIAQMKKRALISLIDTTESIKHFNAIRDANKLCRAVPLFCLKQQNNTTYVHLAELYPMGDVVLLNAEEQMVLENGKNAYGDPIPLQLVHYEWTQVRFVPLGTQRYRQYIPSWINRQLRMTRDLTKIGYPARFTNYNRKVLDAKNGPFSERYLLRNSAGEKRSITAENLCYLASWILTYEPETCSPENERLAMQYCRDWLERWLEEDGEMLACGFNKPYSYGRDTESAHKNRELDLRPLLAAIILLSRVKGPGYGDQPIERIAKELAVHFTRMVGLCCDQSLHIEIILKEWLNAKTLPEMWKRFDGMSMGGLRLDGNDSADFDGFMTEGQILVIKRVCTNVETLSTDNQKIKLVARALLHSIGQLEDYRMYHRDLSNAQNDYKMNILATYGRILTPGISSNIAVAELPESIRKEIERIFRWLQLPLSVMTDKIPITDQNRRHALELCQQYCRENKQTHGHYTQRDEEELDYDYIH